ncbi:hypothetical protein HGRIS_006494 [Hohenbuehelia grisea]|uniref:NADH:flavin oxidoreductase/NADH oxidase N-terminal domain-containing protein n=1 Tax=Hohenbuehelia grisea TaxID=104357 RepID=A0ABR3K2V4_9AGAR
MQNFPQHHLKPYLPFSLKMSTVTPKLFQPIKVGRIELQHRIVLAPLGRMRTDTDHVPLLPTVLEYYQQRSRTPGTLLVSEATLIAPQAGGYTNVPGIWSDAQIEAWKQITDAVHAQGSFMNCQIWAMGRTARPEVAAAGGFPYVSASNIPTDRRDVSPRPLTKDEIKQYVELYAQAASNAVNRAGFDGVEIHGANGYLIDQFLQDVSNVRDDEYGGSIENRARFGLDVVKSVVDAVGQDRTSIRLSPWNISQAMGMADPKPTFSYFVSRLVQLFPNLAYLHLIEDYDFDTDLRNEAYGTPGKDNEFIREVWGSRPFITNGGHDLKSAIAAGEKGSIVSFGRQFISNPDLPYKLINSLPLTIYDRTTFYSPGDTSGKGYTDYPFAEVAA